MFFAVPGVIGAGQVSCNHVRKQLDAESRPGRAEWHIPKTGVHWWRPMRALSSLTKTL